MKISIWVFQACLKQLTIVLQGHPQILSVPRCRPDVLQCMIATRSVNVRNALPTYEVNLRASL